MSINDLEAVGNPYGVVLMNHSFVTAGEDVAEGIHYAVVRENIHL